MPAMGFYDNSREYMHVGSLYLGQGCDEPLRYESTWGGFLHPRFCPARPIRTAVTRSQCHLYSYGRNFSSIMICLV